jgi:hypothetical protein
VVDWIADLLHIRDDPVSNLVPETGYRDDFSWVYSVPPGKCWVAASYQATTASIYTLYNSLSIHSFDVLKSALLKASLKKLETKRWNCEETFCIRLTELLKCEEALTLLEQRCLVT